MMRATPSCTSDRFNWARSTALHSNSSPAGVRVRGSVHEVRGRVAHKAHRLWDPAKIPAVDLSTTRLPCSRTCKKCYPCCRIKVLPMLPVAHLRPEGVLIQRGAPAPCD